MSVHGQANGLKGRNALARTPEQALLLGFINLLHRPATCKASAATFLPRFFNQPFRESVLSHLEASQDPLRSQPPWSGSVPLDPSVGRNHRGNAASGRRNELLSRILCGTQLTAQQGPVALVGLASDDGMMCRTTRQSGDHFPKRAAAVHTLTLRPICATATPYA